MKIQSNPPIADTKSVTGGAPAGKLPETDASQKDGVDISNVFTALDQTTRIGRIAAAVQGGSYQVSSVATGNALIKDALSEPI